MANLILPAQTDLALALREPNLLVPGKKPVGPVEIDWSHPLARGLVGWIVNNEVAGYSYSHSVTDRGRAYSFNGTSEYLRLARAAQRLNVSAYTLCRSATAPGSASFTGPVHAEEAIQLNWDHSNASFRGAAAYKSVAWHTVSFGTINANEWYSLSASVVSNTGITAYKNGESVGFSAGGQITTAGFNREILVAKHPSTYWWDGEVLVSYCWERELSAEEHARIAENPYQILRPANSTPYLISVPTGGAAVTLSNPLAAANGQTGWSGSCDVTYA